jgi:zinc transporter 1/2/3
MYLTELKYIAAATFLLLSLFAAYWPLRHQQEQSARWLHAAELFSAGVFLGAVFFHFLPDATELFAQLPNPHHYPYAEYCCMLSFIALLALEKVLPQFWHSNTQTSIAALLFLTLGVHALFEGVAIGVSSDHNNLLLLIVAVIAHKGSETFAFANELRKRLQNPRRCWRWITGFAVLTPIGVIAANKIMLAHHQTQVCWAQAILTALSAGTFLYIATMHTFEHYQQHCGHHGHRSSASDFLFLVLGMVLMAAVAIWV